MSLDEGSLDSKVDRSIGILIDNLDKFMNKLEYWGKIYFRGLGEMYKGFLEIYRESRCSRDKPKEKE